MEPARQDDDQRFASNSELDSILKEVEASVRRAGPERVASEPEPLPPLAVVDPEPREAKPAEAPGNGVRFEKEIKIDQPGDLKIRSFRLPKNAVPIGLLGLIAAGLWGIAPSGFDSFRPAPLPDAYRDASLRWALVLTAERIDRFREDKMRVPNTLAELGIESEDMIYQPISDQQYTLKAADEGNVIELKPGSTRASILSGSLDVLRQVPDRTP